MKKLFCTFLILALLWLAGCAGSEGAAVPEPTAYQTIDAVAALALMEDGEPFILLDVRSPEEFAQGRIPGAVLIPANQLASLAPEKLPAREARILVYCRSGQRSAAAVQTLAGLGYQNLYDMGGILGWPYETTAD